jgi:DNA-binding MarR family transcriptional regulator
VRAVTEGNDDGIQAELVRIAAFRTELRRFLRRVEAVTAEAGLTPQRYDLLLMIKADPGGLSQSTVTALCESLQLRQTAVTELVKRAEEAGLISRRQSPDDARVSLLTLTPEGEQRLLRVFHALSEDRKAFAEAFTLLGRRFVAASAD